MSIAGIIAGNALGLLGNIGSNKRQKKQLGLQNELIKEQAKTNYEYNELAASNAHERQLELYNMQKEDNSLQAQVQDAENAGLSVGLLTSGASGGVGSASAGAQGQGSRGLNPADAIAIAQIENERKQLGIERQRAYGETKLANAEAKKTEAETENIKDATETSQTLTPLQADLFKSEAAKNWIENNTLNEKNAVEILEAWTRIEKTESDIEVNETVKKANEAKAALDTEKSKSIWKELLIAERNSDSERIKALAAKLAAEHNEGTLYNWKSWKRLAEDVTEPFKEFDTKLKGLNDKERQSLFKTFLEANSPFRKR